MTDYAVGSGNPFGPKTLNSGDSLVVLQGGVVSGITVNGGALEEVYAGGIASGGTVNTSGFEIISAGGSAVSGVVSGGFLLSLPGASTASVVASGGTIVSTGVLLQSGYVVAAPPVAGVASQAVGPNEQEYVLPGGIAVSGIVSNGGSDNVYSGGIASATRITNGGFQDIFSGGTSISATLSGTNQTQGVESGGLTIGTQVAANGIVSVDGGRASGVVVSSGGHEFVEGAGGTASGTTVLSGGEEFVGFGGATSGTLVSAGGLEEAKIAGVVNSATIRSGALFELLSGGSATNTVLDSGGVLLVLQGGSAIGTAPGSGGLGTVISTGVVILSGVTLVSSAAVTLNNTTVSGGVVREVMYVLPGGSAVSTTVIGVDYVGSGGFARGNMIGSGGFEVVSAGGSVVGTILGFDATELMNGSATGLRINSGGDDSNTGVEYATVISGGGIETVYNGAAFGATIQSGGHVSVGVYGGSGTTSGSLIQSGGFEIVSAGASASGTMVQSGGQLVLSSGAATGTFVSQGGFIDLATLPFVASSNLQPNGSDVLTVQEGALSVILPLSGSYTGEYFHTHSDGVAGTLLTLDTVPCFLRGTRVATPGSEVPIEDLRIGDAVVTAQGETRQIRWIGRRSYANRFAARHVDVLPVCIRAGALGNGLPRRDLMVSPNHAMFIDGVLVAAIDLVNGSTIISGSTATSIDYFHLELASHDIILAEGAPTESFVDDDSRMLFQNAAEYEDLYPAAARSSALYCASRVTGGFALKAIRQRLLRPAGAPLAPVRLRGFVDRVGAKAVGGWARNPLHPEAPVCLDIRVDGKIVAQALANQPRDDLARAGIGRGRHGFTVHLQTPLTPAQRQRLEVRRSSDGMLLERTAIRPRAGSRRRITPDQASAT